MNSLPLRLAVNCVRAWTWLYTCRMPPSARETRRAEIASDLWDSQCDAAPEPALALHILVRLVTGMPDDLGWRVEQATLAGTLTQGTIVLGARGAGAMFFICALWAIDVDASRKRPVTSITQSPPAFEQHMERNMTLGVLSAGVAAAVGVSMLAPVAAQSPSIVAADPAFDVASVKPNRSGYNGWRLESQPGRLVGTNATAAALIRFAYELPDFQMSGGPAWLGSDRFDVIANAPGDPSLPQKRFMLRRLLRERFSLIAHTETRELPIYALTMARSDGRIGARLRRSEAECDRVDQPSLDSGVGPSPRSGPASCGFFGFAPGTLFSAGRGGLAFRGLTMAALAKVLIPILHRSVNDQTRLTGYFDGDFDFIAELPLPPPPPGMPNPFDAPFGSIFAVFPDQLGLKLESTKGPVAVLVIDRVEQPTPD
jgi:uncharacterized protein (TIGR03435 family)